MARVSVKGGIRKRDVARLTRRLRKLPDEAQKELLDELEISAQIVRTQAIENIRVPSPSGGPQTRYRPRRTVNPALAGNPPNLDTGTLSANIKAQRVSGDLAFEVISRAEYSAPLEFGFRDVNGVQHGPWPFMFPALEEKRAVIRKRIAEGVRRAFARAAKRR